MRKLTAALAVVCLITMLGAGAASAAKGGTDRPFKCKGTGTFVFNPTTGTVSFSNVQTCTHLGRSTSEGSGPFDPTAPVSYSFPTVAANGDLLNQTILTTPSNITGTSFTLTNDTTFDGGTGRFVDASGSAIGTVTAVVSPSNPLVYNTTFTVVGTISY